MTNENPDPTTFPEALAAIEADNAGPRPIAEIMQKRLMVLETRRHIEAAYFIAYADRTDWAAAYIELMAAANLIAKMAAKRMLSPKLNGALRRDTGLNLGDGP